MGISLKGVLAQVAPVLASFLPGPLGNMAKKAIAEAFGTPEATDAEIEKTLANANPDMLLKLKQAEQDFAMKMEQLGIDAEKVAAEDRASARGMQVQTRARAPSMIALFVFACWAVVIGFLVFRRIPAENADAIMLLLGALTASVTAVVQFYFGSSSQSRAKDDTIKSLHEMLK